jgi:predicted nucleic-acid-binding Zn-ribbon protein
VKLQLHKNNKNNHHHVVDVQENKAAAVRCKVVDVQEDKVVVVRCKEDHHVEDVQRNKDVVDAPVNKVAVVVVVVKSVLL